MGRARARPLGARAGARVVSTARGSGLGEVASSGCPASWLGVGAGVAARRSTARSSRVSRARARRSISLSIASSARIARHCTSTSATSSFGSQSSPCASSHSSTRSMAATSAATAVATRSLEYALRALPADERRATEQTPAPSRVRPPARLTGRLLPRWRRSSRAAGAFAGTCRASSTLGASPPARRRDTHGRASSRSWPACGGAASWLGSSRGHACASPVRDVRASPPFRALRAVDAPSRRGRVRRALASPSLRAGRSSIVR